MDHALETTAEGDNLGKNAKYSGNSAGRWADCKRCGLRLAYWPRLEYVGRYRQNENPEVIRKVLSQLQEDGMWHKCDMKMVKAYISKIEADINVFQGTQLVERLQQGRTLASQLLEAGHDEHRVH
jgi:predicted oxidoreductase